MDECNRDYDVLICGGGVAGVAAALEAARAGLRTALIEKTIFAGGLATTGMVNIYLPICDGFGTQTTFGIAEELLHESMRYGPGEVPAWREARGGKNVARYRCIFSPASFILALDEVMEKAGVDIWFDTLFAAPIMDGRRIIGVEVENKSGRLRLGARCVIDATGGADVAFRAGAPCAEQENGLAMWAIEASLNATAPEHLDGRGEGKVHMVRHGKHSSEGSKGGRLGTRGRAVSDFVLSSRRMLRERYRAKIEADPQSRHTVFPVTLPAMAQFRTTRRIAGRATMSDGDAWKPVADPVGLVTDWRKSGFVWEVPFGALIPEGVEGILACGRCMSSAGDAWEVTRVIPAAALTGQIAGIAAILAHSRGVSPSEVPVGAMQEQLAARKIPYRLADIYPNGKPC